MAKRRRKLKTKKIVNVIGIALAVIFAIVMSILVINILRMNILPNKYMVFVYITILVSLVFEFLLAFPKIPWKVKCVIEVIVLIITCVGIYGVKKIDDTMDFFRKIASIDYEVENYYVLVLKDSKMSKIEDVKGKDVGMFPSNQDTYKRARSLFDEKVKANDIEYDDILKMANDLLKEKVDALLISDAHKSGIEEELSTFVGATKIIDTIEVRTELDNIKKSVEVTEKPFNVFISGIDTYGKISTRSRSDVNIIMTINPVTHEILLTSTPRDYYVQLHGTTGLKDKLTHAGVYGINTSVQTMEDLLGIDINYYIRVNFNTLISVVDVIGGIEIYSDKKLTPLHGPQCHLIKGNNKVDGKCALAFSRERYAYIDGDHHRGRNQQQVLTKIIEKTTSSRTLISNYSDILNTLEGSFQTNMETNQIYSLIKMQLDDMPHWTINSYNLYGEGEMTYTYSYANQKLWVMIPDYSTVKKAKILIDGIMAGKKYSELAK